MSFNLNNCTSDCKSCIQSYIKKHRLEKGDKFQIKCSGIPQEYIPKELLSEVEDQESSLAILDPVTWAAKYLDWHCIDPDGSVWKRKTEDGTLKEVYPYNEEIAKAGKSPYNRPYQATILRCSSRRKVFRCVDPETKITLKNGSTKRVVDLKITDEIISIDDNTFQPKISKVIDIFSSGIKKRYKIKTKQGHEVIVSEDHPFLVKKGRVDKKNGYDILDIPSEWQSIKTGLKIQSRIAICNYLNNETIQDNLEITDDHLKIYCVTWDHVKSIEELPPAELYDLSLDSVHTFIANSSIILHNCGRQIGKTKSLEVLAAFNICTNDNFAIVLIAPYQSQIELFFSELIDMIKDSKYLSGSIRTSKKQPNHYLELMNGSSVIGFTAGSKSKAEAGASRGQHANMIFFDEADILSPKDIDAALAIITNFPDATVCMSSTPTGKRERFFETCKSKNFKEFHFSSWDNPNYTPELDALYREQLTEMGYQHEIEALFGSQEEGVYQLRHIESAQTHYEITEMKPMPDWIYTIGVDWNSSKYGTTIAVTGFNPKEMKFRLVDKRTVKKDGWTQLAACETVAEMNRYWNPLAIYVDRGYGHMQVEILQKFGHDALIDKTKGPKHPDSRLATILKYYDFGGSVEVRDPFTNKMVKKPAKPFLVENSVRRFETQSFQIPKNDEMLMRALVGYRIKRVSEAGVPVYEQADTEAGDHMLDAINLSLVAFTLENTDFGKKKTTFGLTISDTNIFPEKEDKQNPRGIVDRSMPIINRGIPAANTTDNINSQGIIWHGFWNDEPRPNIKKDNLKRSTLFQRPGYKKRSNI